MNRTYDIRHFLDYTIACQWLKLFFGNNIKQLRTLARYRPCPFIDDAMNQEFQFHRRILKSKLYLTPVRVSVWT